ncbi:zinc finger CCHC domain-containing protein 24-like [Galleria mellonella]|uniref:Zinc finger CCHC domain-containing protein 24-like n=1 Tax=Galleria mellonella TaxID=7137 RepID=A0A6J1X416_GALME|nr:zinc finger CCHC domain-containing protein 24-like [Galleria mellonella]XP_031769702.1 zinc finger CCHC domain-containing protein 24-like [Galleria mellonella]XP_052753736.1 zinc finger CCHC domain-containing protein 24-like [Galleria mellonella]
MGACCSTEESREHCMRCNRRAVNNLIIIGNVCEICLHNANRVQELSQPWRCPYFGEYRCTSCGRSWSSRLSWHNTYQTCKNCQKHVYPHKQRALLPSDRTSNRKNKQEHQMDYCQMCQQLGYYCGKFNTRITYKSR